eukprot:413628_1
MVFHSCSVGFTIFTWIWTVIGISMLPFPIWALLKHLNEEKKEAGPFMLSKSALLFYLTSILTLISTPLYKIGWCTSPTIPVDSGIYSIGRKTFGSFWVLQSFLLMIILFSRLYYAFAASLYTVSKFTTYLFIFIATFYFITYVWHLIAAIIDDLGPQWRISFVLLFWAQAINSVYLSLLFTYKLYQISKATMLTNKETSFEASKTSTTAGSVTCTSTNVKSSNDKKSADEKAKAKIAKNDKYFLSIMTKSTILTIISVSITLLLTVMTMFMDLVSSELQDMIWHLFILLDIFTNFSCIALSALFAKKYYLKICGVMDNACRKCCIKLSKSNNASTELSTYIESNKQTIVASKSNSVQSISSQP